MQHSIVARQIMLYLMTYPMGFGDMAFGELRFGKLGFSDLGFGKW